MYIFFRIFGRHVFSDNRIAFSACSYKQRALKLRALSFDAHRKEIKHQFQLRISRRIIRRWIEFDVISDSDAFNVELNAVSRLVYASSGIEC